MSLTVELPGPLGVELAREAAREDVSTDEQAALLLYLVIALLKDENPTPFQGAVRRFLAQRSLDAGEIGSAFEELVHTCFSKPRERAPSSPEQADQPAPADLEAVALLRQWRDLLMHRTDGVPGTVPSPSETEEAREESTGEEARDPERVARVRSVRGRFARAGAPLATLDLHRERQADKQKEERRARRHAR